MIDLYLGVELNDTRRLLSEFDTLLDADFNVLPTDEDNKYLIRLPDLKNWIGILYLNKEGTVSQRIKDNKFSLCAKNGKTWRELTELEQAGLRIGIDTTYQGTTRLGYTLQFWQNQPDPVLTIEVDGMTYKDIRLSKFQKALDNPADSTICDGINNYLLNIQKGFSYDMIFDMYRKGYINLSEDQLKQWEERRKLGL
jgi:hypothetical protein